MKDFIILFACLLPVCILIQLVRSPFFKLPPRNTGADLVEATGMALAFSTVQGITFVQHSFMYTLLLFVVIYLPIGFFADWMRKRRRGA